MCSPPTRLRPVTIAIGLVVMLLPTLGTATIVADRDLRRVLAHADTVVVGMIVEQRVVACDDDGGLLTESIVEVDRWLHPSGAVVPRVTISQLGGQQGDRSNGIVGDVRSRPGQRVLLMLERVNGRMMIVGLVLRADFALFENNPWNPGARLVMRRIPFDRDAIMLSPRHAARMLTRAGFDLIGSVRSLFYFPRLLRLLRPLEPALAKLPLGARYWLLARKPRSSVGAAADTC